MRSELSFRKWGPQSLEEETGPCVRGQVGHGLQVRPTEEQELSEKGVKAMLDLSKEHVAHPEMRGTVRKILAQT